ncbi:hypothetical protein [Arsenophonus sp. ENCA]|uniref:hypothetical protein n=1 Tax=Arsenophonus sp. ENCA TaxID=1987579 RepID=UPI0025BC2964|nr:hypothetical protein [Arsenophonus sp. ENCA]
MNKMALSLCMLSFFCSAKVITHQQLADLWQSPKEEAKQLVNHMSFEEKLGQMLMLGFVIGGLTQKKCYGDDQTQSSNRQYYSPLSFRFGDLI